jgi:hypothetical protein
MRIIFKYRLKVKDYQVKIVPISHRGTENTEEFCYSIIKQNSNLCALCVSVAMPHYTFDLGA